VVGKGPATPGDFGPISVMTPILTLATFRPDYVRCRPNRSPEFLGRATSGREAVGSPQLHSMCSSLDDWGKVLGLRSSPRRQAIPEIFAKRTVDSLLP
jgi:hypothetical protein